MVTKAPGFQLTSAQTAIAVLVPSHQQTDINALRKLHDKAFRKWQPHINLLYPFVESTRLDEAVGILKKCLRDHQTEKLKVRIDKVGVFEHRRNATVFLKPEKESEDSLCGLRAKLAQALGCDESEGTHDGEFRPHLTIGQAGLIGPTLERLKEKVRALVGFKWECATLAVLRRESSGEMTVVDELALGNQEGNHETPKRSLDTGWRPCYSFGKDGVWGFNTSKSPDPDKPLKGMGVKVSTYNVMAEDFAPSFATRLPLIVKALSSTTTLFGIQVQVLCLQEINEESLPLLLADPWVQATYPFSSHSPSSMLPSQRNLVTLSSVPFSYFKLDFEERHKSALIISLHGFTFDVANVHLTSALTNQAVYSKKMQMATLSKWLADWRQGSPRDVIMAGDFNLTTSTRTMETAISKSLITPATAETVRNLIDSTVWEDAFLTGDDPDMENGDVHEGEDGATFDRLTNPFAAMASVQIDKCPQRYDRVLFHKGGCIEAKHFEIFGRPDKYGKCGSDHYGVSATLMISEIAKRVGHEEESRIEKIRLMEDETDVQALLAEHLPSDSDRAQRQTALELLKSTLSNNAEKHDIVLAPLGSYFMDTYFPSSDVDVLVIGSSAPQVFFDRATTQLRTLGTTESDDGIKGVHFVNSLVPIIEAVVSGIKFDLQYCQAPEMIERLDKSASNLMDLVFDSNLVAKLSPASLRPLNTYRDTAYLLNTIPSLPSYRLAHRFLSLYLKNRGLYSAKFGYLGGIHLSLLLNRVVKLMAMTQNPKRKAPEFSPSTIIRTFFSYYSEFEWANEIVHDPSLEPSTQRTQREPVYIQSIHVPTARPNVASSCTRLSAQTFTTEFRLAAEHLQRGDWNWCMRPTNIVVDGFLKSFGAFVKISLDIWDVDEIGGDKVREMVGGLESKMTRLLVSLGRLEELDGRVWPARFRIKDAKDKDSSPENQFKGYYLVGISAREEVDVERKRLLSGKVVAAVREFEISVKTSRELEGGNVWIEMDVIPKKKISEMGLVLDERDWGSSNEARGRPEESTAPESAEGSNNTLSLPTHSHRRSSSNSLRPAQDIISRIKWDPDLSVDDFLIGYEDRFIGVKETELGKWKSEQTDDEFIPMHRIVWVRKKGEGGERVWDRKAKVDLLFGSGIGGGR